MSASPPCSPPRRPLHERSSSQNNSQNNRLQIRVVPYSPPRLSSDASPSVRVVSYADASTETEPETWAKLAHPSPQSSLYHHHQHALSPSPSPSLGKGRAPFSSLRRYSNVSNTSNVTSTSDASDSWRLDVLHATRHPSRDLSPEPSPPLRPSSARRKVINVHSDKTFSVLPQFDTLSSKTDSCRSPRPSNTTASSSYGRLSSAAYTDDRPSSPLTPLTERSISSSSPQLFADSVSLSPWNYRMIGGLRKVPKTPTPDPEQRAAPIPSRPVPALSLPHLPHLADIAPLESTPAPVAQPLTAKLSFQSTLSHTESTLSERTNYKVYGQSSPIATTELDSQPPSSSHSNYHIIGDPSSADASVHDRTRPQTGESEANFVVHGGPSSSTSSLVAVRKRARPAFSRESLVVAPLRPTKRSSSENIGLFKSHSRDSLRTGSLTSISNALTQDATRALFSGPPTVLGHGGMSWQDSFSGLSNAHARSHTAPFQTYHWSSQLSTVISESEGGTESRSMSPTSGADRRSSGFISNNSRHVLSIASSLANLEELMASTSHSRQGSVDKPQAAHTRSASRDPTWGNNRLIRDQDEDGDGLADLEELRHRPSRTRLGRFLTSYASDRSLRSSASSRANSFNGGSIPTWARLYYGSGERRFLAAQASSDSMFSQFSEGRTVSSLPSRSPSHDRQPANIYNPRRRPIEPAPQMMPSGSNSASLEITSIPARPVLAVVRGIKKQTSSIWSPHLGRDRRAARYSIWEPPTADWSAQSEMTGRRNAQIVMFVVGFIFPFAWIIAACIPLPPPPSLEATGHDVSTSNLDLRHKPSSNAPSIDESVYSGARWWRNVNRIMSIIGLLVLGAVVALVVVGVRQRWGS